jgi:hypothetical protein
MRSMELNLLTGNLTPLNCVRMPTTSNACVTLIPPVLSAPDGSNPLREQPHHHISDQGERVGFGGRSGLRTVFGVC